MFAPGTELCNGVGGGKNDNLHAPYNLRFVQLKPKPGPQSPTHTPKGPRPFAHFAKYEVRLQFSKFVSDFPLVKVVLTADNFLRNAPSVHGSRPCSVLALHGRLSSSVVCRLDRPIQTHVQCKGPIKPHPLLQSDTIQTSSSPAVT
jgi:hypothetical protein